MIVPLGIILLGSLLVYAGWTGKSFTKLITHPNLSADVQPDPEPPAGALGPIGPGAESPPEEDEPNLI